MRSITVWLLAVCLLVGGALPAAGGDFLENRIGVGAWAGYGDMAGDSDQGVDFDFDNEVLFGGSLTYYPFRFLSFELSAGYTRFDLSLSSATVPAFELGEVEQVATLLTVRLHPDLGGQLIPYLGFGFGHYMNDMEDSGRTAAVLGPGTGATLDNSYGFHASLGAEYFFGRNLALHLDFSYALHTADLAVGPPGGPTVVYEVDLSGPRGLVGLKYYF